MNSIDTADVGAELVAKLRMQPACSNASLSQPLTAIAGGYDTDIFAVALDGADPPWDAPLILRLFRDGHDDQPRLEAALQNAVADLSYPAPRALLAGGAGRISGRPFMVMECAPGRSLTDHLTKPGRLTLRVTPTLAEAHVRLHELDASAFVPKLRDRGLDDADLARMSFDAEYAATRAAVEGVDTHALIDALAWLSDRRPSPRRPVVCHGDLHPGNIVMADDGSYRVIDWTLARLADAEYDVARTSLLLAHAPVTDALVSGPARMVVRFGRRLLFARYHRLYGARGTVDKQRLRWYDAWVALRAITFAITAQSTDVWRDQRVIDGLMGALRRATGQTFGDTPVLV